MKAGQWKRLPAVTFPKLSGICFGIMGNEISFECFALNAAIEKQIGASDCVDLFLRPDSRNQLEKDHISRKIAGLGEGSVFVPSANDWNHLRLSNAIYSLNIFIAILFMYFMFLRPMMFCPSVRRKKRNSGWRSWFPAWTTLPCYSRFNGTRGTTWRSRRAIWKACRNPPSSSSSCLRNQTSQVHPCPPSSSHIHYRYRLFPSVRTCKWGRVTHLVLATRWYSGCPPKAAAEFWGMLAAAQTCQIKTEMFKWCHATSGMASGLQVERDETPPAYPSCVCVRDFSASEGTSNAAERGGLMWDVVWRGYLSEEMASSYTCTDPDLTLENKLVNPKHRREDFIPVFSFEMSWFDSIRMFYRICKLILQ